MLFLINLIYSITLNNLKSKIISEINSPEKNKKLTEIYYDMYIFKENTSNTLVKEVTEKLSQLITEDYFITLVKKHKINSLRILNLPNKEKSYENKLTDLFNKINLLTKETIFEKTIYYPSEEKKNNLIKYLEKEFEKLLLLKIFNDEKMHELIVDILKKPLTYEKTKEYFITKNIEKNIYSVFCILKEHFDKNKKNNFQFELLNLKIKNFVFSGEVETNFLKEVVDKLNETLTKIDDEFYDFKEDRYQLYSDYETKAIKTETEIKKLERTFERCYGIFSFLTYLNIKLLSYQLNNEKEKTKKAAFVMGKNFHERFYYVTLIYKCYSVFLVGKMSFGDIKLKYDNRINDYLLFLKIEHTDTTYQMKSRDWEVFSNYSKEFIFDAEFDEVVLKGMLYLAVGIFILGGFLYFRLKENK